MTGLSSPNTSLLACAEAFAGDLLRLVRSTRTFPEGHPSLPATAGRVLASARSLGGALEIGATATELVIGREFLGGAGTRSATLAAYLHERKVARISWRETTGVDDVVAFARLLAVPGLMGTELRESLRDRAVDGIDVIALDLERLHQAAVPGTVRAEGGGEASRRRTAWLWLQHRDASPERLAGLLTAEDFWLDLECAGEDSERTRSFARFLSDLGERLEQAVHLVPQEERQRVAERLAGAGAALETSDLLEILGRGGAEGPRGLAVSSLLRDLTAERLVDLMAGLAAASGGGTQRLAAVFRRFAPSGGAEQVLGLVRARRRAPGDRGITAEVWRVLEEFILRLEEEPFMAQDYSDSLEALSRGAIAPETRDDAGALAEEPERHLDWVFLGVASDGGLPWRGRLLARLEERARQSGPWRAVAFAALVDELLPGALDENPTLVRELFRLGLSEARDASGPELDAFTSFCVRHEALLLDPSLKALAEEQRLASRRLLVEVLSSYSPACTPSMVSRARTGPWFVARNLAIVLGRQGGARAVPVLVELAAHAHPKVRREALRALSNSGCAEAEPALRRLAARLRESDDRTMATRLLERTREGRLR